MATNRGRHARKAWLLTTEIAFDPHGAKVFQRGSVNRRRKAFAPFPLGFRRTHPHELGRTGTCMHPRKRARMNEAKVQSPSNRIQEALEGLPPPLGESKECKKRNTPPLSRMRIRDRQPSRERQLHRWRPWGQRAQIRPHWKIPSLASPYRGAAP